MDTAVEHHRPARQRSGCLRGRGPDPGQRQHHRQHPQGDEQRAGPQAGRHHRPAVLPSRADRRRRAARSPRQPLPSGSPSTSPSGKASDAPKADTPSGKALGHVRPPRAAPSRTRSRRTPPRRPRRPPRRAPRDPVTRRVLPRPPPRRRRTRQPPRCRRSSPRSTARSRPSAPRPTRAPSPKDPIVACGKDSRARPGRSTYSARPSSRAPTSPRRRAVLDPQRGMLDRHHGLHRRWHEEVPDDHRQALAAAAPAEPVRHRARRRGRLGARR